MGLLVHPGSYATGSDPRVKFELRKVGRGRTEWNVTRPIGGFEFHSDRVRCHLLDPTCLFAQEAFTSLYSSMVRDREPHPPVTSAARIQSRKVLILGVLRRVWR
jgi:hypothetical protein